MPQTFLSPLFPLPNLVFYPGTLLPLHIFEPRYRAMMASAIEGDGVMTIVQLMPGWEEDYEGTPRIYDIATLGRIVRYQEDDEGKFDLILDGVKRVRIIEEIPDGERLYRLAKCEELLDAPREVAEDAPGGEEEVLKMVNQLCAQCHRLAELQPKLADWIEGILKSAVDPAAFSHILAGFYGTIFDLDAYDRQCILEETRPFRRLQLLNIQAARILDRLT